MRYEAWDAKLSFEAICRLDEERGPQAVVLHGPDKVLVVTSDSVAAERMTQAQWAKIGKGLTPGKNTPTIILSPPANSEHHEILFVLESIPPVLEPPAFLSAIWAEKLQLVTAN